MASKKLQAAPTVHDLVAKIVALQNSARKKYQQIDPLLAQVTAALTADPSLPRVFEVDGMQYEFQDRFEGTRAKARVDQYVSRYLIAATR